jgi:hypothetical protein
VSEAAHELVTGVESGRALLPGPPDLWSYSSLKDVRACALRYALTRASYPDLWEGWGYPPLPSTPAIFGDVVHGALEIVVKALTDAGVESPTTEAASQVLRGLGGLSTVVETRLEKELAPLALNPRLSNDRRRRIERELRDQVSLACVQVQTYLSRSLFVPSTPRKAVAQVGQRAISGPVRMGLSEGSHAEVRLVADGLRLSGRVDLLTIFGEVVTIVDYKTGAEAEGHRDQLALYTLLWMSDEQANPALLQVSNLTAAYRDVDVSVDVPTIDELGVLAASLGAAVAHADAELVSGEPQAMPSVENCGGCAVRHLCSSYWREVAPALDGVSNGAWFDYEGVIGEQNGQRSWWLLGVASGKPELLLRTSSAEVPFVEGDHVRLLGLRRDSDPEVPMPIALLTVRTESFCVLGS